MLKSHSGRRGSSQLKITIVVDVTLCMEACREAPVSAHLYRNLAEWHASLAWSREIVSVSSVAAIVNHLHRCIYALVSSAAGSASLVSGSAAAGSPEGSASEEVQRVYGTAMSV